MANSAAALPIAQNATRDQPVCVRHWHRIVVDNLMKGNPKTRDEKSISRSKSVIADINKMIEVRQARFDRIEADILGMDARGY